MNRVPGRQLKPYEAYERERRQARAWLIRRVVWFGIGAALGFAARALLVS